MKKLGVSAIFLISFFITLIFVSGFSITGKAVSSGNVNLSVEGGDRINILFPLNQTYEFELLDELILDLNVSAGFEVESWMYSLYDFRHETYIEHNLPFVPNTTIEVARWANRLTVYAKEVDGEWRYKSVIFYVNVSNSAPILSPVENIWICEGSILDYRFNATDVDEDLLNADISPKNPFYTLFLGKAGYQTSLFKIFSGALKKNRVGLHKEVLSVTDGQSVDSANLNITVIEINNPPAMENLGAQTVWTHGEDSNFYKQVEINDVEDGNSFDGNLEFNISFQNNENLFSIDEFYGIMNYTPTENQIGVYSVTICAQDHALPYVPENISLCSPMGSDLVVVCDNFTITVTSENRPPQIVDYEPQTNISVYGTENISFYAETYDPDGTIPDIDWYVDGILREHNEETFEDNFSYIFGCDVYGHHNVTAVASDGLLNDSKSWEFYVNIVACPPRERLPEGGGGGGGGGVSCWEMWVCEDWNVCQNLDDSFKIGTFPKEDFYNFKEICNQEGFFDRYCGFQMRQCVDLNNCSNVKSAIKKPEGTQVCYFTENPNCKDGIKNCHDGGCELLIDCGGPCGPCPTCSDSIQNQGEFGIDCGGPCPFECEEEIPLKINWFFLVLIFFLLVLVIFILKKLRNIKKYSKTPFRKEELNFWGK